MVCLTEATYHLRRWFEEKNIPTDGLTVILNLQDKGPAATLDYCLQKEFSEATKYNVSVEKFDVRQFKIMGVDFRVESPLHDPFKTINFEVRGLD